jgi:phosphoglycolate phosphatase
MLFCFDLDGPILDVADRYHRIYSAFVEQHGRTPLAAKVYWQHKRAKTPERLILELSGVSTRWASAYESHRKAQLERRAWLRFDRAWPDVAAALRRLARRHRVLLVTLRQNRRGLLWQLESLGLLPLFERVVTCRRESASSNVKAAAVRRLLGHGHGHDALDGWFVGDSEADLNAGRALGLKCAAVGFGIRHPDRLALLEPDVILRTPAALARWVDARVAARR